MVENNILQAICSERLEQMKISEGTQQERQGKRQGPRWPGRMAWLGFGLCFLLHCQGTQILLTELSILFLLGTNYLFSLIYSSPVKTL